jgi:cobalt/nickel transport system permease protein
MGVSLQVVCICHPFLFISPLNLSMQLLTGFLPTISLSNLSALNWLDAFQPRFALHIPDGFLSLPVTVVTWLFSLGLIAAALKHTQARYQERTIPLMGVCAAFIFAAQMINFPIPGGTSGHLLGGTLAGALLGPWAGSLVMVAVFIVQSLIFQDGGITALGANIFNMGLIGTFGGYFLYRYVRLALGQNRWRGMLVGSSVAAWVSVMVAAVICALQLALSGTVALNIALAAMVSWHLLIGIGEALITVATLSFIWRTQPDLLFDPPRRSRLADMRMPTLH